MTTPTHLSQRISGEASAAARAPGGVDERLGWTEFAAVMIFMAGMFNGIYGIAALLNDDFFRSDELLFGDLSMWGVLYLLFAAVQVAVALLILRRSSVGAVLGIVLAGLNAVVVLAAVGAYPI